MSEAIMALKLLVLWIAIIGGVAALILWLAYTWGKLTYEESPLWDDTPDEPTTVRRLPEIDLPLDDPYDEEIDH